VVLGTTQWNSFLWYFRQSMPVRPAKATGAPDDHWWALLKAQARSGLSTDWGRQGGDRGERVDGYGNRTQGANCSNNGGESATVASDDDVGGDLAFGQV